MQIINLSKLGLGTVQFGLNYGISNKDGQTTEAEVASILNYAKGKKINLLDTASAYGASELVLGHNNLEDFNIVSKFIFRENEGILSEQFHRSKEKLNVESLYGYLAHRVSDVLNNPWLWDEMQTLKEEQQVKKVGFSFNEVKELEKILSLGIMPDIIQVPYNFLDNRFDWYMELLKEKGCEIHTRSAFLQGIFFTDYEKLNPFFDELKPIIKELQNVDNLPGLLIKYCTDKPFIDRVIVGVNSLKQLEYNLKDMPENSCLPFPPSSINESLLIPSKWPK